MFWPNATPSRRRNALGNGREVLVYIDEPMSVESPAASSAAPLTPILTPVRRNTGTSQCPAMDEKVGHPRGKPIGTPSYPPSTLERDDGADFLAMPKMRTDDDSMPLSDFGRTPSLGSACSSVGSISKGHATDDSEASDDDEEYFGKQEENFERTVISVSLADGCIVLEFPDGGTETPEEKEVLDGNIARDVLRCTDKEDTLIEGEDTDEEKSSKGGSISLGSSSASHDAGEETWGSEPCPLHITLQSTNIHSAEDVRERERDKIRLAVLGAAADAYKRISVEVPDLVLAQINESRETMRLGSCSKSLARLAVINGLDRKDNRTKEGSKKKNSPRMDSQKQYSGNVAHAVPEKIGPNDGGVNEFKEEQVGSKAVKPPKRTKRLKLTPEDEIHALPCQCALTLVGMRARSHLTPPNKSPQAIDSNQLAESFITHGLFGTDVSSKPSYGSIPMTPDRRPSLPSPHTAPVRPPARSGSFLSLIGGGGGVTGHSKDDSFVRTSSAKAADVLLPSRARHISSVATPEFLNGSSSVQWSPTVRDGSLKLGGPPDLGELKRSRSGSAESIFPQMQLGHARSASREQRCEASSFTSMGYHEIVLLRRGSSKPLPMHDSWDALTIRCDNHDEMDVIVSSLRMVSKATVVPFSPNPKAKLKKMQEHERSKQRGSKIYRNRKRRHNRLGSTEMRLAGRNKSREVKKIIAYDSACQDTPENPAYSCKEENLLESDQWNKCDHCEICRSQFTILVRRHHCRECDRSCCGSCSSVSFTTGGKGKRAKRVCASCCPTTQDVTEQGSESKKWSKEDHCEMCLCHFTLLTRRHHCRKCDQSVCGSCSSVLLVRGGEEKRYCNRCSTDILQRQSRELHRRFAGYQRRTSLLLPGKVHSDCRRLGVGVLGKLPHWRNYLSFDQKYRPAVGRITVELLEALAVPQYANGKADPYVRATITGYDRDMKWNLVEWNKTFSLCSSYCMGTLSPIWRGSGKKGGELLTLPVLSTAGAVLRLEVMHYDILTNRRGRDVVLGVVEIPLSDITNANLRKAPHHEGKRKLAWDGYIHRWYQLQRPADASEQTSMLAKPISDPHSGAKHQGVKANEIHRSSTKKNGMQSLEELKERFHGWCRVPVEWAGSALNIDFLPRRKDTVRSRSAIRVRIKLNCTEVADLLSHSWFPPVKPYPSVPQYDPSILWTNLQRVGKQVAPYQKILKFIEDAIKWKHPARICIQSYCVFAFHLGVFPRLLLFLHLYLFTFLMCQLLKTARANLHNSTEGQNHLKEIQHVDSFNSSFVQADAMSLESDKDEGKSSTLSPLSDGQAVISSPSLQDFSPRSKQKRGERIHGDKHASKHLDETARLNKAVQWIAKRLGDNRGLEILQFKLGMLGRDLTNLNSLWDGSSAVKICASMNVIFISFVLHCYTSWRLLWIGGTGIWFFCSSPFSIRRARNMLGLWRGMAKVIRRRNLHEVEVKQQARK